MEITVQKAIIASKAIESVLEIKLPSKVAYRLGRYLDKMAPIVKQFEKTRNELITTKYGIENSENPGTFKVDDTRMSEFLAEINELLLAKETVDIVSLTINDFGDVEVPVSFFLDLEGFIIE
mgnify:CR=1 FL=1